MLLLFFNFFRVSLFWRRNIDDRRCRRFDHVVTHYVCVSAQGTNCKFVSVRRRKNGFVVFKLKHRRQFVIFHGEYFSFFASSSSTWHCSAVSTGHIHEHSGLLSIFWPSSINSFWFRRQCLSHSETCRHVLSIQRFGRPIMNYRTKIY